MYSSTLSFTLVLDRVLVNATPQPFYPRERPSTHCIAMWVVLDGCGKYRPTRIRSPDRRDRSESLYRLSYTSQLKYLVREPVFRSGIELKTSQIRTESDSLDVASHAVTIIHLFSVLTA
jgi:hypothetical protein